MNFKPLFMQARAVTQPLVFAATLVLLPLPLGAQSMTVLSSGGDARACSLAAEMTATLSAARHDLDACNRALNEVHLSRYDRAATYVNRGILQAKLDQYQDAMNDYNEALKIDEQLPQAWNGKGNLYYLAGRYDEAIAAYELALEQALPQPHVGYYNLGLVYEKLGDNAAAERNYAAALELMPEWTLAKDKLQQIRN